MGKVDIFLGISYLFIRILMRPFGKARDRYGRDPSPRFAGGKDDVADNLSFCNLKMIFCSFFGGRILYNYIKGIAFWVKALIKLNDRRRRPNERRNMT